MHRQLDLKAHPSIAFTIYKWVFFALPFLGGLYFTWQWCLAATVQAVFLLWQILKNRKLILPCRRMSFLCGIVILLGAVWNILYGIDRSAAWDGMLRLAAVLAFAVLALQWDAKQRAELAAMVPLAGAGMVCLCLAGGTISALRPLLYENGRMAGTFQYANTFAAFLVAGLAFRKRPRFGMPRAVVDVLLLFGVVASGSRGGLMLLGLWLVYMALRARPSFRFWVPLLVIAAAAAAVALLANGWVFARFLRPESFSTILGRILYMKDGMQLLQGHPLGVGYLGWFYLQRMVQTGTYNVRFVHNELLQFALDYGVPAAVAAVGLVASSLRNKPAVPAAALLILLHCMADPGLQFLCMAFVLVLALLPEPENCRTMHISCIPGVLLAMGLLLFTLPRGAADAAFRTGNLNTAIALAPYDTELATEYMLQSNTLTEAEECAGKILRRNPYQPTAWQIVAEYAMEKKDYDRMATAQRQAVILLKYNQEMYDESIQRVQTAIADGWPQEKAAAELVWLLDRMDSVLEKTDPIGWMLKDKPELSLPGQTRLFIRMLEQATRG